MFTINRTSPEPRPTGQLYFIYNLMPKSESAGTTRPVHNPLIVAITFLAVRTEQAARMTVSHGSSCKNLKPQSHCIASRPTDPDSRTFLVPKIAHDRERLSHLLQH